MTQTVELQQPEFVQPEPSTPVAFHHLDGAKRFEVLAAVMVVMFFSSMASTAVSTALPNIVADLHGLALYGWIFTAYILASAVVIPIYGKLSDVVGRRPLYIVAIGLFVAGNLLAGFAKNMEMLIAARAISGLGGGGLQALSQITIGDIFTPQERGRWMGLVMSAFGLAAIIGPILGGWITDTVGWPWVFWINIPFSILPLAALLYALPSVRRPARVVIDYVGSTSLVLGLVPLLLAVTWLGENYSVSDPRVLGGIIIGMVFLAVFVWQELRTDDPIISPALFKNRIFVVSMLASFCLAFGMYGAIIFVPLFVQGVIGDSAQNAGVALTPMMVGFMVGSFLSGQLVSRWGRYRIQAIIGLAVGVFGLFLFGLMDVHTGNATVVRNMVVLGLGIGFVIPLFTIAVQNAFPYRVLGAVTGARQFFMALGGAVGVPIMSALLTSGFTNEFANHLPPKLAAFVNHHGSTAVDPNALLSSEAQTAIRVKFLHAPSGLHLYHQFVFAIRDALAVTMQSLFHVGLFFLLGALVMCFFLREIPLRRHNLEPESAVADKVATIAGRSGAD